MNVRKCAQIAGVLVLWAIGLPALTSDEGPDALIKRVAAEVIELAKGNAIDAGDGAKLANIIDSRVVPNVDFDRMTAAVVGRAWRQATPEQQDRLQQEFKSLLVRTYAGALGQVKEPTVTIKPLRAAPEDNEVIVRTVIKGQGSPIQVDYRMARSAAGWMIYDINAMGVWLVESYRGQFAAEINAKGIDGLIAVLADRNKPKVRMAVGSASLPQ
jgi:phospholipid transport system substrate-binding protein